MRGKLFNAAMYVRPAKGASVTNSVKFQFTVRSTENENHDYFNIGTAEYKANDDLLEWKQMRGSMTVPSLGVGKKLVYGFSSIEDS